MAENTPTSPETNGSSTEQAPIISREAVAYSKARDTFSALSSDQKKALQSIVGTYPDGRFGNETYLGLQKTIGNTPLILSQEMNQILDQFRLNKNIITENSTSEQSSLRRSLVNNTKLIDGMRPLQGLGIFDTKISPFKPLLQSHNPEYSGRTTLCSRTAFKNLESMGCPSPIRGASARDSFHMYNQSPNASMPPPENTLAADLYFDASPKNRVYGHRVAAYRGTDHNWYVLDPYYNLPGTSSKNEPKPMQSYIDMMRSKGRNFWGGFYFT